MDIFLLISIIHVFIEMMKKSRLIIFSYDTHARYIVNLQTKSAFQKLSLNSKIPMGKSLKRKFRDQGH